MAMIDEGVDVIKTGEEVVANVKQFLQSGCACSKGAVRARKVKKGVLRYFSKGSRVSEANRYHP